MLRNSTLRLGRLRAVREKRLGRFLINEGDLSSLHNKHHVVDHQVFLKDNRE
jgi:hypothetical protein